MNSKMKNAAHEIGHVLFALRHKIPLRFASIVHGRDFNPQISLPEGTKIGLQQNVDFTLGGWAGEAYFQSHDDGIEEFQQLKFLQSLAPAGLGAGWPLTWLGGGGTDLARLKRAGVPHWKLVFPVRKLVALGKQIHEDRRRFHTLVDAIASENTMNGEWLLSVAESKPVTAKMREDTFMLMIQIYGPKKER